MSPSWVTGLGTTSQRYSIMDLPAGKPCFLQLRARNGEGWSRRALALAITIQVSSLQVLQQQLYAF